MTQGGRRPASIRGVTALATPAVCLVLDLPGFDATRVSLAQGAAVRSAEPRAAGLQVRAQTTGTITTARVA